MSRIFPFLVVLVLFSVFTTREILAAGLEFDFTETSDIKEPWTDRSAVPGQFFSTDADIFLGQYKRRRSGGGRAWTNLYYGDTTLKPKEGGRIHPDFYGFQLGFDVAKSHGIYSTFFASVNQSKTKLEGARSTVDNYLLGYGKLMYLSMCHFVFTGSLGYDRYKISADKIALGDGLQANFFGEFGLDFLFGKWGIKPFYALQYDFLYHGNIGHTPTVVKDWNGHGLNQLFGLRLNWKITDMLELQSRAVWVHEMLDKPPPFYHARFSPVPGINSPAIMFYEGNTGRDWAWLGIGSKFEGLYNLYLFFDYDTLFNERHVTHLGSIGLCLGW